MLLPPRHAGNHPYRWAGGCYSQRDSQAAAPRSAALPDPPDSVLRGDLSYMPALEQPGRARACGRWHNGREHSARCSGRGHRGGATRA